MGRPSLALEQHKPAASHLQTDEREKSRVGTEDLASEADHGKQLADSCLSGAVREKHFGKHPVGNRGEDFAEPDAPTGVGIGGPEIGPSAAKSCPRQRTLPLIGFRSPANTNRRLDLPTPD